MLLVVHVSGDRVIIRQQLSKHLEGPDPLFFVSMVMRMFGNRPEHSMRDVS